MPRRSGTASGFPAAAASPSPSRANVAASVASGIYQNPATVTYLDPTRTAAQTVTPGGTYTAGGTVPGSNYAPASTTNEDINVINPPPSVHEVLQSRGRRAGRAHRDDGGGEQPERRGAHERRIHRQLPARPREHRGARRHFQLRRHRDGGRGRRVALPCGRHDPGERLLHDHGQRHDDGQRQLRQHDPRRRRSPTRRASPTRWPPRRRSSPP